MFSSENMENRRKYVRVHYDAAYSLDFMINENANSIIDLSEKGIRYRQSLDSAVEIGQDVTGRITMKSINKPYFLSGNVARIAEMEKAIEVAVIFNKELQLPRVHILREYHHALKARSN